jgi:hypothetical protein
MLRRIKYTTEIIWIAITLILNACTATLAPGYDKAIVDGLTSTNISVMELFAAISDGTKKDTYSERDAKYNLLIGHFDALELQARSRPEPNDKLIQKANKLLLKRGVPLPDSSDVPSAHALNTISKTISKMKVIDKSQGITATEVQAFKNQVSIYMDQALTYESFLKR